MKALQFLNIVTVFFIIWGNILGQNKIETLQQITLQDGSDLVKSIGHYRMSSLFDDPFQKKKNASIHSDIDTLDLYWEVLKKIVAYNPKSYEEQRDISYFLPQLLTDIIKDFGDQQYEELTTIYKSLPDTSYLRGESFLVPFVQYQVYKEIKQIIEDKTKPSHYLSDSIISFDENTKQKKLECINKYKLLFNSVKNHYQQRALSDTSCGWFSVQYNERLFYKTIEEILFNSSINDFKNLNKFRWGGWCGTGSEYFYSKQLLVELLILLREKDYLSILGRADYYSGPNLSGKTKIKLLELCNIDWINYYTGSILSGEFNSIPSFFTSAGDKAALNLFEFRDSITNKGWYIVKCAEFFNPDFEKDRDYFDFFDDNQFLQNYEYSLPFNIIPVNHEIKNKLKQEIIDISSKADEFNLCQFSIDALTKIKFDVDVKNALLSLTKSRFSMIRNNAANILKKKGVIVELPKDDGKIKFKFIVDEKPLKQDKIGWELYNNSKPDRPFLNGSEKTTDEGILYINRDILLDQIDEIKKIVFFPDEMNGGAKQVVFEYSSQFPKNLNDTTIIKILTVSVSVQFHLNRTDDFYKNKKMRIFAFPPKVISLNYELGIKDIFEFPIRFQKNIRCSFSAYIPGALTWFSFIQDTLKDDVVLDAYLENGSNVTFNIVPPGGKDADKWVLFDLVKTGNSEWDNFWNYDYSISGYESLPIGEYNLIISSSAEKKSKYQKSENECSEQIIAEYPDYEGKIISFTISEDSPTVIDLGIIKLEPIK